jgi:hypothetical protein
MADRPRGPQEQARDAALPDGVEITGAELSVEFVAPKTALGTNQGVGYYESFNLSDRTDPNDPATGNILSAPDGIVLTTGVLRWSNQEAGQGITCANAVSNFGAKIDLAGGSDISGLYAYATNVDDEVGLSLTFTNDRRVAGLRFKLVLASDEFPEWAADTTTPADKSQQQPFTCYPDTFATFIDGFPTGFIKDAQGHDILLNVAQGVITLNNNISPGQDHDVLHRVCGGNPPPPLDPARFTPVSYQLEYDGFAAKQTGTTTWEPLTISVPLEPSKPGFPHTLKLVIADMAPSGSDGVLDTAAFVSDLQFVPCHCPPQDADGDADVDLADFGLFQGCFNGPNRPWNRSGRDEIACVCFDDDRDGDVDLADYAIFEGCFNGPNRAAACR